MLCLCVCRVKQRSEENKMVTVLALADEERLSEKVKMYPCLYDKTTKGYKEKDVLQNSWNARTQNLGALRVLFGKLLFRTLLFLRIISCISISSSSSSELLSLYILSQPCVNSKGRKRNTRYNFKPTWFLVETMNI